MTSRSLLDSKFFDNLLINNLYVLNNLKVSGNFSQPESFLFSIHFNDSSNSSPFTILDNYISLKSNLLDSNNANIIAFSDRPFRNVINITYNDLITLFSPGFPFYNDPPNVVIVSSNSQAVFTMRFDHTSSNFTFTPNSNTKLDDFINKTSFSIFIDNISVRIDSGTALLVGVNNNQQKFSQLQQETNQLLDKEDGQQKEQPKEPPKDPPKDPPELDLGGPSGL